MGGRPDDCVCNDVFVPVCAEVCDDADADCMEEIFDNECAAACAGAEGRPGACEDPNPGDAQILDEAIEAFADERLVECCGER